MTTRIDITLTRGGFLKGTEASGMDESASFERFLGQVEAELRGYWPDAEIMMRSQASGPIRVSFDAGIRDADGRPDYTTEPEDQATIQQALEDVFSRGEFWVEATDE